jgi:hypothetical protein
MKKEQSEGKSIKAAQLNGWQTAFVKPATTDRPA